MNEAIRHALGDALSLPTARDRYVQLAGLANMSAQRALISTRDDERIRYEQEFLVFNRYRAEAHREAVNESASDLRPFLYLERQ